MLPRSSTFRFFKVMSSSNYKKKIPTQTSRIKMTLEVLTLQRKFTSATSRSIRVRASSSFGFSGTA
jgi:hypothetical protein